MSKEYQNPESICIFGTGTIQTATNGLAKEAYFDGGDMIAVVENEEDLATLTPDYDAMCKVDGRGLVITAKSKDYDFVSRCFYPKLNVPEDPVTGSAHTYLTPPLGRPSLERPKWSQNSSPPVAESSASNWEINASSSPAKRSCSCRERSRSIYNRHARPDRASIVRVQRKTKKASRLG